MAGVKQQTSLMRRPAPYAVMMTARCLIDPPASSSFVTSLPLKISGTPCATFGHGIAATTSGRSVMV